MRRSGYSSRHRAVVGRAGDQRADRGLHPGEADEGAAGRRRRCAGRRPRQLGERRPEAGVGAPAVVEDHLVDGVAGAEGDEGVAEAARPAVGLERHAVRLLEPAAHGRRVQALDAQVGVGDARRGVGLDARDRGATPTRECRPPGRAAGTACTGGSPPPAPRASSRRTRRARASARARGTTGGRRRRSWSPPRRTARRRLSRSRSAVSISSRGSVRSGAVRSAGQLRSRSMSQRVARLQAAATEIWTANPGRRRLPAVPRSPAPAVRLVRLLRRPCLGRQHDTPRA